MIGSECSDLMKIVSIPSFKYIILQGIVGSLPWNAMVFFTLWFQLIGFQDYTASFLMSTFTLGCAFGGVVGGYVVDRMSMLFPNSGRIMTAQFSIISGLPLTYVLLKILPIINMHYKAILFGLILLLMGTLISWCGIVNGNNNYLINV